MEIESSLCMSCSAPHCTNRTTGGVYIIQKGKKYLLVYLEEHVSRFYSPISSHSSSFHDRADVNAAVSPVITLTNNTDTQKVVLLCEGEKQAVLAEYPA